MPPGNCEEAAPMPVARLQISPSPTGFRERSTDQTLDSSAPRRSIPLHTRRSVSSMKGLLPLALSPSCSSLRSQLTQAEDIEQRVDEYLPELLARDLEVSKAIFEARSMTAGAPIRTVSPDFPSRIKMPMLPFKMSSPSPSSYHSASTRVQSLEAIEERQSTVAFLEQQDALKLDDTASDLESMAGSETSFDAEPPSFRMRQHSIVTNATSLASAIWRPSSKSSPMPSPKGPSPRRESSWIDVESDVEEGEAGEQSMGSHFLPRPPTPNEADLDLGAKTTHSHVNRILHRKSHSMTGSAPLTAAHKKHLDHRIESWQPTASRFSSQQQHVELPPSEAGTYSSSSSPKNPTLSCLPVFSRHANPKDYRDMDAEMLYKQQPAEPLASDEYSDLDDEKYDDINDEDDDNDIMFPPELSSPWKRPNTVYISPSPPPSPLPSIQAWLNGNTQPCILPFQNDELARLVPLPPDAMETLRVSTACFPETMLLCSSLTVETIRSYSKKVRNPGLDVNLSSPPPSPVPCTKRSLWRRVVKRGSLSSDKSRGSRSSASSTLQSPSSTSLETPKPWLSIKNVFGSCSDYICDALYAHLIAYNYISALVARNPPTTSHGRPYRANQSQNEDIPKKAASLLGLNSAPGPASLASRRAAKRVSSSIPAWAKEDIVKAGQIPTTSAQDAAFRNLQAELLRCIRRLIATARLMAETGSGDDRMPDMDTEDQDTLFMRSLCEIVRISEEEASV